MTMIRYNLKAEGVIDNKSEKVYLAVNKKII